MTDQTIAPDTDNLDDFELLFSGRAKPAEAEVEPQEPELDDIAPEDEPLASTDTDPDEPVAPAPKKKQTVQERFNELTAKVHEAERARDAERLSREEIARKLEEISARLEKPTEPVQPVVDEGPTTLDANEDGTPKYPLGEFDPQFIRDLTKFTIEKETSKAREELKAEQLKTAADAAKNAEQVALQAEWSEKVTAVTETLPDYQEKIGVLDETFSNFDPAFGEYIASTIMGLDHGPEILYYFSDHIDEAKAAMAKGPVGVTLALGKLEAQFANKQAPAPRITNAPDPSPTRVRGSGGKFSTPGDTDDLDAFEKEFFNR